MLTHKENYPQGQNKSNLMTSRNSFSFFTPSCYSHNHHTFIPFLPLQHTLSDVKRFDVTPFTARGPLSHKGHQSKKTCGEFKRVVDSS